MIMANMETNSEERKVIDNVLQRDDGTNYWDVYNRIANITLIAAIGISDACGLAV